MPAKMLLILPEHGELPKGAFQTAVVPPTAHVTAKQIVSYGLGSQNTITLSSRNDDGCMLALQRDIVTLSGALLERQEIPLPPLTHPENALAASGALLITGCPPERLSDALTEFSLT